MCLRPVASGRRCPWVACGRVACSEDEAQFGDCNLGKCKQVMRQRAAAATSILKERVALAETDGRQLIVSGAAPKRASHPSV